MDTLARALALSPITDDLHRGTFTPDWGQGRAAFGGLVAGWCVAALRGRVDAARALRSITVTFNAPLAPGEFEVETALLRVGRATTQGSATLRQAGAVVAVASAAFGLDRPTRLAVPAAPAPVWPGVDDHPSLPYLEGVTPAFTRHFEYRWAHGGVPFSGSDEARFGGWIRPRDGAIASEAALVAIADAWPAPVLARADRVVPASSLTWLLNLLGPPPAPGWLQYESGTVAADAGYADIDARLWGPDGALLLTSRQLVVEFSA